MQHHRLQLMRVFDRGAVVDDHMQPVSAIPDGIILRPDKNIHGLPRHYLPLLGRFHHHPHGEAGMNWGTGVRWRLHRPLGLAHRFLMGLGGPNPLGNRLGSLHGLLLGLGLEKHAKTPEPNEPDGQPFLHPRLLTPSMRS